MNFVGNYDDLHDIASWCWTKIPMAPEEIEVTYQGKTFQLLPPPKMKRKPSHIGMVFSL
jgi:hypothetical protein